MQPEDMSGSMIPDVLSHSEWVGIAPFDDEHVRLAELLQAPEPPALIDVRTPREWDEGHIDAALNLPLSHLTERIEEVPRDRELVVYCTSGYRSSIATSLLRQGGIRAVRNLVGGLAAWESGAPAVAGEA